jgi:Fe-S cluster biogenesis protein NfuA
MPCWPSASWAAVSWRRNGGELDFWLCRRAFRGDLWRCLLEPIDLSSPETDRSSAQGILLDRIERVLDEHVRSNLQADGGDIVVVGIDADNIVQVRLTGACQGCSSSVFTISMQVEAVLKAHIPEIRFIEAVL